MEKIPYNRIPIEIGQKLNRKPIELITTKTVSTDMSIPFWMKIESTYKPK